MKKAVICSLITSCILAHTTMIATAEAAVAPKRDPLKQPFASTSIWNMPIGKGAVYAPAGLKANPGPDGWTPMPQLDLERIVLKPTAPLTPIYYNSAAWTKADRCAPTTSKNVPTILAKVHIPEDYVVPNSTYNNAAALLAADGRTIIQAQPFTRCKKNGSTTSLLTFPPVDIYGDGILGAHGGSKLSSLGGTIRIGELTPTSGAPRHALKVDISGKQSLYNCSKQKDCFRWPAISADSGAVDNYGSATNNKNTHMKMGALLAIPIKTNINKLGLETKPAQMLAWTLQNYGAYIVDDSNGPAFVLSVEDGADGSMPAQFKKNWGYDMAQRVRDNTPWSRDMGRIFASLAVVANNDVKTIGGGGAPLQPLAPALTAPAKK